MATATRTNRTHISAWWGSQHRVGIQQKARWRGIPATCEDQPPYILFSVWSGVSINGYSTLVRAGSVVLEWLWAGHSFSSSTGDDIIPHSGSWDKDALKSVDHGYSRLRGCLRLSKRNHGAGIISITKSFTVRKDCNVTRLSETGIISGQDCCVNNVKPRNA